MKLAAARAVEMTGGAKPCGFPTPLGNRFAIPTFPPPRRLLDCFLNSNPERSFPQPSAQASFRLILRLEKTLNGWKLAGIVTLQSGTPFSVLTNANAFTQARADFAPGFTASDAALGGPVDKRLNEYFNTAAFVSASGVGNFGDTPRNFLRGPNQRNVDFSVVKFIPLGESRKLEFRTEFFNLFNSVNFANPVNMRQSSNFGQIVRTSAGSRVIQFAFKFNF